MHETELVEHVTICTDNVQGNEADGQILIIISNINVENNLFMYPYLKLCNLQST